jgi:tetratricopeptide (TPR) repeat protein
MHLGRYREAIEVYKRGLELAPNDLVCVYNIGVGYSRLQDPRAREFLAKAIDLWERTDHSKTTKVVLANQYEAMSNAYLALGKTEPAIEHLEAALNLSREFGNAKIFSSVSYALIPQEKFVSEIMERLERARSREGRGEPMKRDMDLIRTILFEVEKSTSPDGCQVEAPGWSRDELYYNAKLAQEAGLIDARFLPGSDEFHVLRLTYSGHEFLDAARNDTLWAKGKEIVIKNTGTLTLEALKIALQALMKQALGG